MSDNVKKKPEAWAVRKIAYAAAALVVGVLGAFGILSEVQADQWAESIDKILPWVLGVVAPAVAAAKTNSGSDSTVTVHDVERAKATSVTPQAVADEVMRQVNGYGQHAQKQAQEAVTSVKDYYKQQGNA